MSDYTKCIDVKCPSREKCFRYMVKSSPMQSYADFNRFEDADSCESFWLILPDANNNLKSDNDPERIK